MIHNEKGLSLLEVLVSMIILAIGILGVAPMVVLSMEENNISQDMLIVANLAKDRMEYYETLDPLPAMPYEEVESGLEGTYDCYTRLYDNTSDTTLNANICNLELIISWVDKSGHNRSTTYATYIAKG